MPKPLRIIVNIIRLFVLVVAVYVLLFASVGVGKAPDEMSASAALFSLAAFALSVALSPTLWTVRLVTVTPAAPAPMYAPQAPRPGYETVPASYDPQQQGPSA